MAFESKYCLDFVLPSPGDADRLARALQACSHLDIMATGSVVRFTQFYELLTNYYSKLIRRAFSCQGIIPLFDGLTTDRGYNLQTVIREETTRIDTSPLSNLMRGAPVPPKEVQDINLIIGPKLLEAAFRKICDEECSGVYLSGQLRPGCDSYVDRGMIFTFEGARTATALLGINYLPSLGAEYFLERGVFFVLDEMLAVKRSKA